MKVHTEFRLIRKVVAIFSVLLTLAFAFMFWSMHNSSRTMIIFFLKLAGAANALLWGLLMVSWYFEKGMPSPRPRGGNPTIKNDKT